MLAPRYIRYGNLVTDLGTVDNTPESFPITETFPSINAAKKHIRSLRLPPRTSQTMHFKSRAERRRCLFAMSKQIQSQKVAVRKITWR